MSGIDPADRATLDALLDKYGADEIGRYVQGDPAGTGRSRGRPAIDWMDGIIERKDWLAAAAEIWVQSGKTMHAWPVFCEAAKRFWPNQIDTKAQNLRRAIKKVPATIGSMADIAETFPESDIVEFIEFVINSKVTETFEIPAMSFNKKRMDPTLYHWLRKSSLQAMLGQSSLVDEERAKLECEELGKIINSTDIYDRCIPYD